MAGPFALIFQFVFGFFVLVAASYVGARIALREYFEREGRPDENSERR